MTHEQEEAFWTMHAGLPRQAPGSDESTLRLLALANMPRTTKRALDIGCGPGRSTLLLAKSGFAVTSIDTSDILLDELRAASKKAGYENVVTIQNMSMFDMSFNDGSFDLLWAEGSAYIAGWNRALKEWQRLICSEGKMVLTECCWLTDTPSEPAKKFWQENYPTMLTVGQACHIAEKNGLTVEATYILPDSDWWNEYYSAIEKKFDCLDANSDSALRQVMARVRKEIDLRKNYASEYGYVGFILSKAAPLNN